MKSETRPTASPVVDGPQTMECVTLDEQILNENSQTDYTKKQM
jgi:hypothetical protein